MNKNILKIYWQTLLWFSGILYASFTPKQTLDTKFFFFENQDKVIHLIMYLGLLLIWLQNTRKENIITTKRISFIFLITISTSLLIEFLQPILSNRTFDITDFYANSLGAFLGVGGYILWNKIKA